MSSVPTSRPRRSRKRLFVSAAAVVAMAAGALVAGFTGSASAAGTLLSQNQPVVASSIEGAGTPASAAVDGNTTTRWSSAFSDPQWIYVDLGASASISQVVLNWEAAYATGYQIQTSPDATTWTTIYTTTTGTGGIQTLNITGTGRYVRMYGTARVGGYGYSLYEFQVYGTIGGGGGSCNTTTNAALNKTATTSSTENAGTPASSAFDGNTGTRWSSAAADPQWLEVDLGSSQTICQVTLNWETAYGKAFQIQTSTDNVNWTNIYSTTTSAGGIQTLSNLTGTGRYVRMYGTVRGTQYGYSLWEFSVYLGTGGGGTDTTPPSAPANLAAGATTTTTVPLTWTASTDNVGVTGYHIYRNGTQVGTSTGTSYTDTGLAVSTTYSYTVKANDAAGNLSGASNTATATTLSGSTLPGGGPLGSNVIVFDSTMSMTSIQSQLDTIFTQQETNQFGTQRYELLFKPGNYTGLNAQIGFYTSIAGLGQNPDQVSIHGDVTVDAGWDAGNATQNFWRSAENMELFPVSGTDRWAVAQAAPFRRMDVQGGMTLASPSCGWASGGYIADSRVTGQVSSCSQQQWYTRNSTLGSWTGSVWNMVFSGVNGAPAQSFPNPPYTVLPTTPVSAEKPYLYTDSTGAYRVFVPSLQNNSAGATWLNGNTPGTSLPLSQFYVAQPGVTSATLNQALAQGLNLLFTPGVYHITQTLNVTRADTIIMGLGYATLVADNGVLPMSVGDVNGVKISSLLFDAGTTNSPALLQDGPTGASATHTTDPNQIQDVFFRVGGAGPAAVSAALIVNNNNTIIDHIWAWRADHGAGAGWTTNPSANGLIVNGQNVLADGLFVEHFQQYNVIWNGNGGKTIFFQNELPYDPPSAAAWSHDGITGYAAYKVANTVTTHEAWGLGSYCVFTTDPSIAAYHSFEVPNTAGVKFHDILTVSLGQGSITHVINDTGAAAVASSVTPSNVTSYP
jgi:chitodextrinase